MRSSLALFLKSTGFFSPISRDPSVSQNPASMPDEKENKSVTDINSSLPLIITGRFNYNEAFSAFLKSTTQKKDIANVVGILANKLRKYQVLPNEKNQINILDIGCANGSTCIQYLDKINHTGGFNYFGIDTNEIFIAEAKGILSTKPMIIKNTLITGDAFCGNLKLRSELSTIWFDLVFVSHAAYYINNINTCRTFMQDVANLLSVNGVTILLHENSFHHFREKYSNFGVIDTPVLLEQASRELNFDQFKGVKITSKLNFVELNEDLWEVFKHPEQYRLFRNHIGFVDTLQKLAFIVQRDFLDMEKEGSLTAFINDAKKIITKNGNCFYITTHLQIVVSPQCVFQHAITTALQETETELSRLPIDTSKKMHEKSILPNRVSIKPGILDSPPLQIRCSL